MNYFDTIVSKYRNKYDTAGVPVRLGEFLHDPLAENRINAIRHCSDKIERDIIKGRNPAVTVSSNCTRRKGAAFNTGLIMVDVDAHQNPHIINMPAKVQALRGQAFIWYCGPSASGRGFFCIIPVSSTDFLGHWRALEAHFKKLGIVIDPEPKSPASLRYQSYNDPAEEWYNHNCTVFMDIVKPKPFTRGPDVPVTESLLKVERLIKQIEERRVDICASGGRGTIIAAMVHAFGKEKGGELAYRATRFHPTATEANTEARASSFLGDYAGRKTTLKSFYGICYRYGIS